MRWLIGVVVTIGMATAAFLYVGKHYVFGGTYDRAHHSRRAAGEETLRLKSKARDLQGFLRTHKYNSELCFLADMRLPSGKDRFFVYDLGHDSVLLTGLVAHGCGGSN